MAKANNVSTEPGWFYYKVKLDDTSTGYQGFKLSTIISFTLTKTNTETPEPVLLLDMYPVVQEVNLKGDVKQGVTSKKFLRYTQASISDKDDINRFFEITNNEIRV